MKLIKPSYNIIEQQPGLLGIYKQIERAGRICYKSEDKITDDSAEAFVQKMVDSKHYAMLEHGTVYLHMEFSSKKEYFDSELTLKYSENPFSKILRVRDNPNDRLGKQHAYVITNLRVLWENGWMDDLKYICEPTEYHERRHTVHFIADAGVMREFFRHRAFSLAQESTRYCDYSKGRFNSELTFIIPPWCNIEDNINMETSRIPEYLFEPSSFENKFFLNCMYAEESYKELISLGYKPQQARFVLPLSIKAEGIMTGFASDWNHFFDLRAIGTTGAPHPQAKELAEPLMQEFKQKRYISVYF